MFRIGIAPYYECSSRGDKRFSALYAKIRMYNNKSIEELYQSAKVFPNGKPLHWQDAKNRANIMNYTEVSKLYAELWDIYLSENPELYNILINCTGLSDMFGHYGNNCQVKELWRLRNEYIAALS